MRPLKLLIEGLRSFRAPVTIDFEDRDLFAVVGDTGAGKSSILDAITYALYRQTTFSKQPNQELMNAFAEQMRVALTFRVSGQIWVVTRALKRTKDGVVGVPPELSRLGDDGRKRESFVGAASVDNRIQRLVGLDGDAFLRTVVLPQGNFARLLIVDTPAERSTVLRQVWRTDELEKASEIAGAKANEAKELRIQLDVQASRYPEDPDAHLKTLRKYRTAAHEEAKHAKNWLDAVSAAVEALETAAKEVELCQGVLDDLDGAEVSKLEVALDKLQSITGEIDGQDKALAEEAADVEAKINEILQDDDGPSLASVTATIEGLSQVDSDIRKLAEMADDWRGLRKRKAAADKRAAKAEKSENGARQAAEEHGDRRKVLDDARSASNSRRAAVEARYAACEKGRSDLDTAQEQLADLRGEVEQRSAHKTHCDDDVRAVRKTKVQMDAALLAATRADCAAGAAHGLHPGDACPICDRELPVDWQRPVSEQVGEAERRASTAAAALQRAQQRAEEAGSALVQASTLCSAAESAADAKSDQFQDAIQALRDVVPEFGPELPARAVVLDPLHRDDANAQAAIEQHEQEQVRIDEALRDAVESANAAKANALSLERQAAKAQVLVSTKVGKVSGTLQALPEQFLPNITLPDDLSTDYGAINAADLSEKRKGAEDLRAELEEAERIRNILKSRKRKLQEQRDALSRRRRGEVEAPLADVLDRANEILEIVTLAVGKLGKDQNLPAALAMTDLHTIRSGLVGIREALEGTRQAAGKRLEATVEKRQKANATLAEFAKHLNVAEGDADAIVEAANQANIEAQANKLRAERAFDDFNAVAAAVRQLHAVRIKTEAKERALAALDAALKDGAFLKSLTLRRSRSLLSHASVMLKQISGDRYAFADPGKPDASWHVLDNDTGQARSPASLSGGEQFIASLALALGMVEMMARSGGRLESLFLDEGFGSLDRNNLDAAVEALAMVATRGRMVGVISHVRAVAEQFDNVLAVTREETGSRAVWLSNQQRQEVAADALSGLLD